jgi:high-affinity Fe2+/Pb2+ permease
VVNWKIAITGVVLAFFVNQTCYFKKLLQFLVLDGFRQYFIVVGLCLPAK